MGGLLITMSNGMVRSVSLVQFELINQGDQRNSQRERRTVRAINHNRVSIKDEGPAFTPLLGWGVVVAALET